MLTAQEFGKTSQGEQVTLFKLTNAAGASLELLSYGCAIRAVTVPDRTGGLRQVGAGYDDLDGYEREDAHMGAVIGRTAGRIANARFTLNGRDYALTPNDGKNQLHGGAGGFDRRVWSWRARGDGIVFSRLSPDGEEGFPGNLQAEAGYTLTDAGEIVLDLRAVSDADTYCSLTSHAYWNLGLPLDEHLLRIWSDRVVEAAADLLPTGRLLPVAGTQFDFRDWRPIAGAVIDHSFPVEGTGLRPVCALRNPENGITLTISATLPSIHVYTGNFLPERRSAIALEAQYVPNGMNSDVFPAPLLRAGEVWAHKIVFKFTAD